jgi:hypothetical protein
MRTLLVDTAGRLHTKSNLMDELAKLKRVLDRQLPGAPHESLMVLEAPTGQNGLQQARMFHKAVGLTGLVLTKLDGTAKGGIAIRIHQELGLPIKLVGVGERIDDLQAFDPKTSWTPSRRAAGRAAGEGSGAAEPKQAVKCLRWQLAPERRHDRSRVDGAALTSRRGGAHVAQPHGGRDRCDGRVWPSASRAGGRPPREAAALDAAGERRAAPPST